MIRIQKGQYRTAALWQDQTTYQDQGLHEALFKLLERLWVKKKNEIQILGVGVYEACLNKLREEELVSEETFSHFIFHKLRKAQEELIKRNSSTIRILNNQSWFDRIEKIILKSHTESLENQLTQRLNKWYRGEEMKGRLTIQRISGEYLPMANCYINLAVVAYQGHKDKQDKQDKQAPATSLFHRLTSAEQLTHTNLNEPIPLKDLFKPRPLKDGKEAIPKHILVRGRAGIDKTTFAKKSLYDHIEHGLWKEHFNRVLWIPLRHLKGKPQTYQLETLFHDEYFEGFAEGHKLAQALHREIQSSPDKTLLLLDGWDEIAQDDRIDCLNTLLNHPRVVITSRPSGVPANDIEEIDLELETLGFSETNVTTYLNKRKIVASKEDSEAIQSFIKAHPFVKALVNIPIQLDALCFSWDDINNERATVETMTGLYQTMVNKLWKKDIIRLEKQENRQHLTEQAVKAKRFKMEPYIKAEAACLGALALKGLVSNQIEFKPSELHAVINQLKEAGTEIPTTLKENLMQLSCLQVERNNQSGKRLSYQFLHLTFQEFFAAQWIAQYFNKETRMQVSDKDKGTAHELIKAHTYNPRYEIV